jgi:hypothetical protein
VSFPFRVVGRARRYELPNDVAGAEATSLLLPANLLFFAAKLDEAFKLVGVSLGSGGRLRSPTPKRSESRSHTHRRIARTL